MTSGEGKKYPQIFLLLMLLLLQTRPQDLARKFKFFTVVRKAGRFGTKIKSCFFFSLKIRFPIAVERPEAEFGSVPTTEA